jgi:hypothetical protein
MEILREHRHEIATIAARSWAADAVTSHRYSSDGKEFGESVASAYKAALATLENGAMQADSSASQSTPREVLRCPLQSLPGCPQGRDA